MTTVHLLFFKALLNIIGGKGAISNINYYYYYYYIQSLVTLTCHAEERNKVNT